MRDWAAAAQSPIGGGCGGGGADGEAEDDEAEAEAVEGALPPASFMPLEIFDSPDFEPMLEASWAAIDERAAAGTPVRARVQRTPSRPSTHDRPRGSRHP